MLAKSGSTGDDGPAIPHEFSGGQRSADRDWRADDLRPKLVVLDEPTSALELTGQWQIVEYATELCAQITGGVSCLSHGLKSLRALSQQSHGDEARRCVEIGRRAGGV